MTLMILFGLGLRMVMGRRCPVCGYVEADDDPEVKSHRLACLLLGIAADAAIDRGLCPKCGSEGNDPRTLRAAFIEWRNSPEAEADLEDDADAAGIL